MPLKTKRWNDPAEPSDGFRLLICRIRPRGVPKEGEPWDAWRPDLGPSKELLDAFHGKHGAAISWSEYKKRYLAEMKERPAELGLLARLAKDRTVTLLCSS